MGTHKAEPRHKAFRDDMIEVLRKHGETLTAMEMLALSSHMVGQIIAMQDSRIISSEMAMEMVARNIEQGNAEAIGNLLTTKGRS